MGDEAEVFAGGTAESAFRALDGGLIQGQTDDGDTVCLVAEYISAFRTDSDDDDEPTVKVWMTREEASAEWTVAGRIEQFVVAYAQAKRL